MAKGFNLTAELNLRGPSNIRQVVGGIRKQLSGITADVNVKLNAQSAKQINTANQSFQRFNKTLRETQNIAAATTNSFNKLAAASGKLAGNLQSIPQNVAKTAQAASQVATGNAKAAKATQELTSEFAEFGKQSALAVRRFAAFATVTGVIYKVSNAINRATQDFIDFEKELVKVAQVSGSSVSGLGFLVNEITSLSTGLGVASQDLIGVSRTLTQAGLSATQTSKALEALAKSALAPTFDDLNRTVEGSVALMRQFGISANQLEGALGSINAVAGQFAVEAGDIITAISRTGGVFASASKGVSQGTDALNEFIAVFTSVRATTRESAETIATGLRTIFTRIQRADTIDALKAYGVELQDLEGKFVGPYEATRRLAEGLRQLDPRDIRFSRIVEELGGFRQIGKVIPLIQQFTTAQRALSVAQQGQGSLARDAATAQLSLANQIAKVQEEFTALVRSIGQSQGFQDLVRIGLDLSSAFIAVADAAKSALPAITAIFAIKGFKALTQFGSGFLGGIKRGGGQTLNSGGYVHHFARGGVVPGSGSRDTVPAMLQPGEFVIRKKAVEKLGTQRLHEMNKYDTGGVVDIASSKPYVKNLPSTYDKPANTPIDQAVLADKRLVLNKQDTISASIVRKPIDTMSLLSRAPKKYSDPYREIIRNPKPSRSQSQERGLLFENILEAAGKVEKADVTTSRIDAKSGNTLIEIKSTGEQVSTASLLDKVAGAIFRPRSNIDKIASERVSKKSLSNEPDDLNIGKLQVFEDEARLQQTGTKFRRQSQIRKDEADQANKNSRNLGGYIQAFASGGSAEDTVPAMLTPGEFVINKKAASRIGSQRLNKLNKADRIQGFNKGGAVGRVQRFANGGEVFDFADNIAAVTPAAERAMDDLLASIIAEIAKAKPNISFDDARLEAEKQVGGTFSPGLKQAAEAGDQGAAKAVYQAQRQQVVTITKQIRENDRSIPISQARAAAEQKVAAAWGGLVTKTTTLSKVTSGLAKTFPTFGSAISKTTNIFRRIGASTQSELGQAVSKFGTVLAFVGTTLADQVGQGIGGTTGAGVSAAGGAIATGLAVGSQFGPYGALVGGIAGAVQAISSYTSAVAKKEAEIAGVQIDQTIKESEQARQSFAKGGADTDATKLVANFQKIQQLEQQRVQANVRAEQPGLLSRGLNFVSGGYFGGDRRTAQEVAGARTADEQMGGAEAQAFIASMVDAGKSYKQVSEILNSQGVALEDLYGAIAEANPAYQQEVAEINKANMAESLKTKAIDRAKKKYADQARSLAEAEFADKARTQASAKLAKQINIVSASITRTFANLNQSIDSASNGLKNASDEIQRIVSGATGFTANLESINVLQNPRAFSRQEQNAAISQGAQFAGRDRGFVEQLARFSLDAEDIVASGAARAQQAGPGAAQANIAKDVINDLTTRLEGALGQNELTNRIRTQLEEGLAKAIESGDNIDLQKLLEESGFTKELDFSKQTFDALQRSLKFTQDALNFAANAANEYGKLQQSLRDYQANYQATIIQSDQALKKALGQRVSVRESITGREKVAATRAGVAPQQFNAQALAGRRDVLKQEVDRIRAALQRTSTSFDTAIPGTEARFTSLTKKLAETESALKATETGLEKLPSVIEGNINDIIGEIGNIQQEIASRQQAQEGFAEKLVGSTPQELAELTSTFNLLNNTLNGQITTIQQSEAAQRAYSEAIQRGGTQQEAFLASQQAFANQTKSALSLFNELSQFSGVDTAEIRQAKADLLENFAQAQGLGVQNNPLFRSLIEGLRQRPEDNPEIKALKDALDQQQAALAQTFDALSSGVVEKQRDVLTSANQQFIKALNDVKLNFNIAQLREAGLGLGTPGQATGAQRLEKGGVVYASKGQYVNYQPKGTDTVPAMLTPGEFVVNAQATKNNLGLLKSINSSAGSGKTFSKGGVVYAAGGLEDLEDYINPYTGTIDSAIMDAEPPPTASRSPRSRAKDYLEDLQNNQPDKPRRLFGKTRDLLDRGRQRFARGREALSETAERFLPGLGKDVSVKDMIKRGAGATARGISNVADDAVRGTLRGVTSNARGIGTQLLIQGGLNYAGVDPDVAQGVGMGVDVARGMLSGSSVTPFGMSGSSLRGASATTLGVNTGLDALQTSYDFIKDPKAFDKQKRRESEESIGVIGGGLAGLSRPVDTIVRGGYTAASAIEASNEGGYFIPLPGGSNLKLSNVLPYGIGKGRSELRTERLASRERQGQEYWTAGFTSQGANYINEMIRIGIERDRILNSNPPLPNRDELLARLKRQEDGFPQPSNMVTYDMKRDRIDELIKERIETGTQETIRLGETARERQAANSEILRDYNNRRAEAVGLPAGSTEANIREAEANAAVERSRQTAEARQKEEDRRKSLGLRPGASKAQVENAKTKKKADETRTSLTDDIFLEMKPGVVYWLNQRQTKYQNYKKDNNSVDSILKDKDRLPPDAYSKQTLDAIERRKELYSSIESALNSKFDTIASGGGPVNIDQARQKFEQDRNARLEKLYSQLNEQNQIIQTDHKNKKYDTLDNEGIRRLNEQYRKGQQEKEEKEDRRKQRDLQRSQRENARIQGERLAAIAKFSQITPPDKFSNPSQFFAWRKNVADKLQRTFPFASQTPEALKTLGISPAAVDAIYEPFSPDQATAIYSAMLNQPGLSRGASRVVSALKQAQSNLANNADKNPALQKIIANASDKEKKEIARRFQQTFGKQARQVSGFNKLVANFSGLDPRRQAMARANVLQRAVRQGVIDPSASDEENINRLNAMRGGNIAKFLYPNRQTQNRVIRSSNKVKRTQNKSDGGVIYASTGMMVPYEPRGTDTVPAMLTPGEFVINRAATQKHRPLLEAINRNKGGAVKYLQDGGTSTDITKFVAGQPIERENQTAKNVKENLSLSKGIDKTSTDGYNFSQNFRRDSFKDSQNKYDKSTRLNDEGFVNVSNNQQGTNNLIRSEHQTTRQAMLGLQILDPADIATALTGAAPAGIPNFAGGVAPARGGPTPNDILAMILNSIGFSRGGPVPLYAQKGMMVNYQPKGTDTVPAMLTPGEFVVNAKASKENLGLLQAINSGYMSDGGVVYAQDGMQIPMRKFTDASGKHSVMARIERIDGNKIILRKDTGKRTVPISISQLSKEDQTYVNDYIARKTQEYQSYGGHIPPGAYGENATFVNPPEFDYSRRPAAGINQWREYTDSTGKYKANGKLLRINWKPDGKAQSIVIKKEDGTQGTVSLDRLSWIDQFYINGLKSQEKRIKQGFYRDSQSKSARKRSASNYSYYPSSGASTAYRRSEERYSRRSSGYYNNGGVVYAQKGRRMSNIDRLFGNQPANTFTGKSDRGVPFGEFLLTKSSYKDEKEGEALQAFGIGAAKGVAPTAAGVTAGAYATAATAPILGPAAPIAGLIAGVGAAGLTAASQEGYLDFLAPQANAEARRITSENPLATNLGGALPGMGVGLAQQGLRSFAGTLAQRTVSGGASVGIGAGIEYATTGNVDLTNLGVNFGTGFTQPGVGARPRTAATSKALEESFTVYHGGGSRLTTENIDVTRGGGIHGEALYTSRIAPGQRGDMATTYAQAAQRRQGYEGGIFPINIRGKLSDFPEAQTPLSENPRALKAIESIFNRFNLDKTTQMLDVDPNAVMGSALLGDTGPNTYKTVGLDLPKQTFETMQKILTTKLANITEGDPRKAESLFRQAIVEAGIPGIRDTTDDGGQMAAIFDQARIKSVGSPMQPPPSKVPPPPFLPPAPFPKKNKSYSKGGIVYAQEGKWIRDPLVEEAKNIDRTEELLDKLYLQETDKEEKLGLLDDMKHNALRRQQFNYSDSERSADNLHEMIQDMIGGNRPDKNNDRLRRYSAGSFQKIIQDFYDDNIRPKDSTKGYEGLQKKYVEGATSKTLNKGGIVYANQGMLVPYQPKGTDTVPAMLTPGEFVVNRQATQKNLPLLKSINRSRGGQVTYLKKGGLTREDRIRQRSEDLARKAEEAAIRKQKAQEEEKIRRQKALYMSQQQQALQQQQQQQPGAIPQISRQQQQATAQASQAAFDPRNSGDVNRQLAIFGQLLTGTNQVMVQFGTIMQEMVRVSSGVAGNGQPGGVNTSGIEQFTQTFQTFVQQLSETISDIPPIIKIEGNVTANVNFAGAEALRSLADTTIRELVESEVNRRFNQQNRDNEGQIFI